MKQGPLWRKQMNELDFLSLFPKSTAMYLLHSGASKVLTALDREKIGIAILKMQNEIKRLEAGNE
jgi:hypothetical protein